MNVKVITKERSAAREVAVRKYRKSENVPDKCESCGWHIDKRLVLDRCGGLDIHHVVPVAVGGTDDKSNLIVLCPNCHATIHALWQHVAKINYWGGPTTKKELLEKLEIIRNAPDKYLEMISLSDSDLFGDL